MPKLFKKKKMEHGDLRSFYNKLYYDTYLLIVIIIIVPNLLLHKHDTPSSCLYMITLHVFVHIGLIKCSIYIGLYMFFSITFL